MVEYDKDVGEHCTLTITVSTGVKERLDIEKLEEIDSIISTGLPNRERLGIETSGTEEDGVPGHVEIRYAIEETGSPHEFSEIKSGINKLDFLYHPDVVIGCTILGP